MTHNSMRTAECLHTGSIQSKLFPYKKYIIQASTIGKHNIVSYSH